MNHDEIRQMSVGGKEYLSLDKPTDVLLYYQNLILREIAAQLAVANQNKRVEITMTSGKSIRHKEIIDKLVY